MNNDTIGTASVKITADIRELKAKVEEAKTVARGLEGFTINAGGEFSGNWEEYQQYIANANKEYEEYIANQESATVATEKLQSAVEAVQPTVEETAESVHKFSDSFATIKDAVTHPLDTMRGSFEKTKDAIEDAGRLGRTAIIGLATAITAYGKKSIEEYAKYNENAKEAQEELEKASTRLKLAVGQLLQPIATAITGIMNWVSENRALVSGFLTFAGVLAGSAGVIALVNKLKMAMIALKTAGGGILGIISVLAGLAVGVAASNMEFEDYNESLEDAKKREEELTKATNTYNQSVADMNKQIADAQEGIAEATRSYEQSLKKILDSHESTVDKLTNQIRDANSEYERAIEERTAAFNLSMQKEEEKHQDKVDELQSQIDFLQRYNNKYNREKLEALTFALEKENNRHKQQTAFLEDELEVQNRNEKAKLEQRLSEYEKELKSEQEFLRKHRDTLNAVRNVIVDDEVVALKRQHEATLKGYNEAIETARQKGREAGETYANALKSVEGVAKESGKSVGNSFGNGFLGVINSVLGTAVSLVEKVLRVIIPAQGKAGMSASTETEGIVNYFKQQYGSNWKAEWQRQGMGAIPAGYALGGYTGQGASDEVAGIVHKGEYVLPQEAVNQETGLPKAMGNTFNITVSGVFATSASERRKVAEDIKRALEQTNYARLGA